MSWRASGEAKKIMKGAHGEKLRHADKLALLIISDSYNESEGYAWESRNTLAKECLCSESTIRRLTDRLERFGLLTVEHRDGASNLYRLPFLSTPSEMTPPPLSNQSTRSSTYLTPTPVTHLTPELDLTIPLEQEVIPTTELKFPKPKSQKKSNGRWSSRLDRRESVPPPRAFVNYAALRRQEEEQAVRDNHELIDRVAHRRAAEVGRPTRQEANGKGH